MIKKALWRMVPTHTTVIAYLALFMAMGGTAYAAAKWTSADIADGTLTGVDIQDDGLTSADIAPGSIVTGDLAPGTVVPTDGSGSSTLLGAAHNPGTVTGPLYAVDNSAAQVVASVTFTVPADKRYYVQISAQANVSRNADYVWCNTSPGPGSGEMPSVYADGNYEQSLLQMFGRGLNDSMTASQALVFEPGEHTVAITQVPYECSSFTSPGATSLSNSFLAVNLLAEL